MRSDKTLLHVLFGCALILSALACKLPTKKPTPVVTTAPPGELVQGSEYSIKLIEAERTSEEIFMGVENNIPQYLGPRDGYVILKVSVEFYQNGEVLEGNAVGSEPAELSVTDSKGAAYQPEKDYLMAIGADGTMRKAIVFFEVPENSTGFELRYRDTGVIDLGL